MPEKVRKSVWASPQATCRSCLPMGIPADGDPTPAPPLFSPSAPAVATTGEWIWSRDVPETASAQMDARPEISAPSPRVMRALQKRIVI